MTEDEWLTCDDPQPMLEFLRGKASARKLRLFACACCRRVWPLLLDERTQAALGVAEQFADRLVDEATRARAEAEALRAGDHSSARHRFVAMAVKITVAKRPHLPWIVTRTCEVNQLQPDKIAADNREQTQLLRDIVGSSLDLDPDWLTPTITALAQFAYDERELPSGHLDPVRLAILADALEEVGCADAEILTHLRGPGPHVRGCWAIDLLLGMS